MGAIAALVNSDLYYLLPRIDSYLLNSFNDLYFNVVTKLVNFSFQTLMSAMLRDQTNAVPMLCVTIPRDRITVHVNLDFLEMDGFAKVHVCQYHGITY